MKLRRFFVFLIYCFFSQGCAGLNNLKPITPVGADKEYRSIVREVNRLWRPPVGVSKGISCRVKFTVGLTGTLELIEFITRSNNLVYDQSISTAVKLFEFDECLWGKQFIVDFCQ